MKTPHHRTWVAFGLSILFGILVQFHALAQVTPFIESGDDWRVLDNGTDPGGTWKSNSFVETAAWRTIPSSFGYTVASPSTYNSDGANSIINFNAGNNIANLASKYITTYFRKTFSVSNPSQYAALFVSLRWDDGVVVYLNGVELRRENMPAGTPAVSTLASVATDVKPFVSSVFSLASPNNTLLLASNNVLAIEVHQANASSSDIFLDAALDGFTVLPSFGNATPGVSQTFDGGSQQFTNDTGYFNFPRYPVNYDYANHYGYIRDQNNTDDVLLQYETYSYLIANPGASYQPPVVSGGRLLLSYEVDSVLNTERVDTRNYTNVKAYVDLGSLNEGGPWGADDYLRGTVLYSLDGVSFTEAPWFNYQASGVGLQEHVLVDTNAPFHWFVPNLLTVSNTTNTNTTTNPTEANWTQRVPNSTGGLAFADYNTPPSVTTTTAYTWHAGNLPASTIKGGIGYDRQTTSGVDYTPYLDSGTSAQANLELYNKESRVNVRYPFTIPVGSLTGLTITKVELQVRYDDAFAAWLNGTAIASDAKPTADTAVPGARDDATCIVYKAFDVTSIVMGGGGLLRSASGANDNVLAVRGYNAGKTSTDMLLGARLVFYTPVPQPFNPTNLNISNGEPMTTLNTGNIIPTGTRSVRVRITSHIPGAADAQYFYIDNIKFTGDAIAATNLGSTLDFQMPSSAFAPEKRVPEADGDGDGIANILEYAFGSNAGIAGRTVPGPSGNTVSITPEVSFQPDGRAVLKFRTLASATANFATATPTGFIDIRDLRYYFQMSAGTSGWNDFNVYSFNGTTYPIVQNNDGTMTVSVISQQPLRTNNQRYFFRLKVNSLRAGWLNELPDGSLFPEPF